MQQSDQSKSKEVWDALVTWSEGLQALPGWKKWNRAKIAMILSYGDEPRPAVKMSKMFDLPDEIDKQHAVMMAWLHLNATVRGMRACASYLRRAPNPALGISSEDHLRYMIELYFSRVYEFSERLKKMMNAMSATISPNEFNTGDVVKNYKQAFKQEIAARNTTHHDAHFDDISLDQLGLVNLLGQGEMGKRKGWKAEHSALWREASKVWRERINHGAEVTQMYVENVAVAMLNDCLWLTAGLEPDTKDT